MSSNNPRNNRRLRHVHFPLLVALVLFAAGNLPAAGTWTPLANSAPAGVETMLLLSDATVMATDGSGNWYRLTPDLSGSYINGTWSMMPSMNYSRLYFSSDVLPDGRVFVAGGEYGTGGSTAEIYDPVSNAWTVTSSADEDFSDSISMVLPDGNVMVAPVYPSTPQTPAIYDPVFDIWTTGPQYYQGNGLVPNQDEASWVKLPDDSILTVDPFRPNTGATNSERYIPSLNQWLGDAKLPVLLYDANNEIGPGLLLPDGRAFFMGATGHTALYTPSGTTNPGSWIAGPDIPDGLVAQDNPCAMLANGKILCAFGTNGTTTMSTSFYEYDPVTNAFTAVDGPGGGNFPLISYELRMLDLPDGTVLMSLSDTLLYVYQPDGSPLAAGKPTISGIATNSNGSYLLRGKLFNGISAGAVYGDDAQMDSNYPLVRMNDTNGNVYYARTVNWSSTGVMTGSKPVTTQFWLPAALPNGNYSLVVVANGIASDPVPFSYANAFMIQSAGMTNGAFSFVWNSIAGQTYHVQFKTNLLETNWLDLAGVITATNNLTSATDTNISILCPQKFYRVLSP